MHLGKQAGKQTEETEIEWIQDKTETDKPTNRQPEKQTNRQTDADQLHLEKQAGKQIEQTEEREIEWIRNKTGIYQTICTFN